MRTNLPGRFWDKVISLADGCWQWTSSKTRDGYGTFHLDGKSRRAHRLAFMDLVGPIPDDLVLDHLCRNRACVNPAHLEPVTRLTNARRGQQAMATHCKSGHPFDEANTYVDPAGKRNCRACNAAVKRRTKAA